MNILGLGSAELLLLLFFASVILGPRRVITLAREIGKLVGQVRSITTELTRQVHQEIALLDFTEQRARPAARPTPPAPPPGELPDAYQRFREEFPNEGQLGGANSAPPGKQAEQPAPRP